MPKKRGVVDMQKLALGARLKAHARFIRDEITHDHLDTETVAVLVELLNTFAADLDATGELLVLEARQ